MSKEADEIKGMYFPCLDHGFVSLLDYMGGDDDIVQAARVSYGAGTKKVSDDRGLLRYLMRHRHTGPFEMVELKFHVKLPIFVARQLIRHRTASLNEYSLRYSLPSMQFYVPKYENTGMQNKKNKQGRAEQISESHYKGAVKRWEMLQAESAELYSAFINPDVDMARELARMHLPLSLYTEWYWKMDLHNLFHFLSLRSDGHAQWEIQEFSNLKAGIVKRVAPMAFDAWMDYRFKSASFSRQEMQMLKLLLAVMDAGDSRQALATNQTIITLHEGFMTDKGLSKREIGELFDKFKADYEPVKFDLDLSTARTAEFFLKKAEEAVPQTERK